MGLWLFAPALPHLFAERDPADPAFRISDFRFANYGANPTALQSAVEELFPVGTPKERVDSVLVEIAGAEAKDYRVGTTYDFVAYRHKADPFFPLWIDCPAGMNWNVKVHFDASDALTTIDLDGPCI